MIPYQSWWIFYPKHLPKPSKNQRFKASKLPTSNMLLNLALEILLRLLLCLFHPQPCPQPCRPAMSSPGPQVFTERPSNVARWACCTSAAADCTVWSSWTAWRSRRESAALGRPEINDRAPFCRVFGHISRTILDGYKLILTSLFGINGNIC